MNRKHIQYLHNTNWSQLVIAFLKRQDAVQVLQSVDLEGVREELELWGKCIVWNSQRIKVF